MFGIRFPELVILSGLATDALRQAREAGEKVGGQF
jgi:hypothetical protein